MILRTCLIEYVIQLFRKMMHILTFVNPTICSEIFQDVNQLISYYTLMKVYKEIKLVYLYTIGNIDPSKEIFITILCLSYPHKIKTILCEE